MAVPCSKSEDMKDMVEGNDSGLGVKEKDADFLNGNDSGLGEETFSAEDILAASGPKLMFRFQNQNFSNA